VYGQEKQTPESPQQPASVPVSYGLVIDNSGSLRLLLDKVIRLVSDIVDANGPEDEAFLVTFVDTPKIALRQEFTADPEELKEAADSMFVEGGKTAIVDAVKSSADYFRDHARKGPGRSRVMVLVSDGDEGKSETTVESVLGTLKEEKIRVFAIAIAEGKPVTKLLDRLSKETGGKTFAPKNTAELADAVKSLTEAIRTP
jgi:VWFA-related protein